MMKLKEKLKNWLFKEELNDIKETKEKYDKLLRSIERAEDITYRAQEMHYESQKRLEDCHRFMNSICDVGTDIGFRSSDHSWAVICVHGKMDYVKFVDMHQSDIRTIANFLKNFKHSNMVTDSPLCNRELQDMIMRL